MDEHTPRRIVLTIPAEAFAVLQARAEREMRPTKTEALKLLLDALKQRVAP